MESDLIIIKTEDICRKTKNRILINKIKMAMSKKSKSVISIFAYIDGDPEIYKKVFLN